MQSGGQVVSASSNDSNLGVYAVREQNGHVDLLVINKSASNDLTGTFNFTGFTPSTSATYWHYGKTEDTAQSQTSDGHASLSTGTAMLTVNGSNYSYIFSSYSMTVLDLTPVNQVPTNITLSNALVAENQPLGTAVGTFSSTDPDTGNTFTYSLVSGSGSTDNASFTIVGNTLETAAAFDYETKNSYSIRVRTTDQGGLWYEKPFTISVTDVAEAMIVQPGDLPATGTVNLTLIIGSDSKLHIYQTGTMTDIVPANVFTNVTNVSITGRDNYDEVLTIDFCKGNAIPWGGVSFNGGAGDGNSLILAGTSGGNSVVMSAAQITDNSLAPIYYSNVTYFGFNLVGGSNSLSINNATLKINQDNAISAGTDVTINGGTLDLNGKTDTIGNLLLESGSLVNGTLYANAYIIESGTATANIVGPGSLQKTTAAQATVGAVSTPNVTLGAGELTAISINTGILTLSPGTTLSIAAIPGGPSASRVLRPLAARSIPPILPESASQPAVADAAAQSAAAQSADAQSTAVQSGVRSLRRLPQTKSTRNRKALCNPRRLTRLFNLRRLPWTRPRKQRRHGSGNAGHDNRPVSDNGDIIE